MSDKIKNTTYTRTDIEKYLQGKMSFAEMHQFELAALDDPFLSDAIEGYAQTNREQTNKNIEAIEAGILLNPTTTKIINLKFKQNFNYLKIAASVFAVLLASFFVYKFIGTNNSNTIQKEIADNIKPANTPATNDKIKQQTNTQKNTTKLPENITPNFDNNTNNNNLNSISNSTAKTTQQNINPTAQSADIANADKQLEIIKRDDTFIADTNIIASNNVTTNTASNAINYSNNDIAKFSKPRSGYSNENTTSNNINLSTIKLKADTSFKPVASTNFASKAKKETRQSNYKLTKDDSLVVPANGWAAFNEYVKNNTNSILITDTTKQNITFKDSRTGEDVVDLEFFVDKDGKPNQITVAHSTNPNNDSTAINLLKNGPKWITTNNESSKKKAEISNEKKKAKVSIKINQ